MSEIDRDDILDDLQDEQLPPDLEELLAARAHTQSELPWLAMRVDRRIEALEQARQWLVDNPSIRVSRGPRALLEGLSTPRVLTLLGSAAVGAVLGQQLSGLASFSVPWIQNASLVCAVLGAVLAALSTQVPYLRSMVSD